MDEDKAFKYFKWFSASFVFIGGCSIIFGMFASPFIPTNVAVDAILGVPFGLGMFWLLISFCVLILSA